MSTIAVVDGRAAGVEVEFTIYRIIGVFAHPLGLAWTNLDRYFELDDSVTKRLPSPNDTFSDSYARDLSNATLLEANTLLVVE